MKKLITILLSVLLIASLFVSCDNATKAVQDELVEVTLSTQATGRSLTVSNPLESLSDVAWTYKATKVSETQFNYGEKITETEIDLYPESGEKQKLTLSQGKWVFELFGRNDSGTLLYYGITGEVLILRSNGLNQITVEVSPYTDALGQISFNGVKLVKANGDQFTPNYLYVTGPNGYVIPEADKSFNGTKDLPDLKAGQYTVTVAWKETMTGDNPATPIVEASTNEWDLVIASETIVVTVYGGRTTEISGNISEETGSGTIQGEYVDGNTSVIVGKVEEGKDLVLVSSVVPVDKTNNSDANTTVTFPAGAIDGSSAQLTVEVKGIDSNFEVSIPSGETATTPVSSIDLTVKVDGEPVTTFDQPVTVVTYILKNLTNVKVLYGNEIISGSTYDPLTGKLTFTTTHFSKYDVISDVSCCDLTTNKGYSSVSEALNSTVDGSEIRLLRNCTIEHLVIRIPKSITIDLNNHKLSLNNSGQIYFGASLSKPNKVPVSITLKSGTIEGNDSSYIRFEDGNEGYFENISFLTNNGKSARIIQTYATNKTGEDTVNRYEFKNCTFDSLYTSFEGSSGSNNNYQIKFEGCSFSGTYSKNGASCIIIDDYDYGSLELNGVTFNINSNSNAVYCLYVDTYLDYTNGSKFNVKLNNVVMNTTGTASPYMYEKMYYNGTQGVENAVFSISGNNTFTKNGVNVEIANKGTSSLVWVDNAEAFNKAYNEWSNYANTKPESFNSNNYYLVKVDDHYYVGGQGVQFVEWPVLEFDDKGNVSSVKLNIAPPYVVYTYRTIGTDDISTELGASDDVEVKIYTLAN